MKFGIKKVGLVLVYVFIIFSCKQSSNTVASQGEEIKDTVYQTIDPNNSAIADEVEPIADTASKEDAVEDINYQDEYKGKSLVGHFIYMADAAVFTPCGAKKAIPVEMYTEVYKGLEKAYLNTVDGGTPCFVEVLGTIKKRPSYDGGKAVNMLVIDKVIEVQFYRECP